MYLAYGVQLFVVSQSADFFPLLLLQYQLFHPVSHGNTRVLYLNTILNPRLFNPNSLQNIKMPYSLPMQIKLRDTHTKSTQLSTKVPNTMYSGRQAWRTCPNSVTLRTCQSSFSGIMGSARYFQYLPPVANGIQPPKVPGTGTQEAYLQSGHQTIRSSVCNAPISVSKVKDSKADHHRTVKPSPLKAPRIAKRLQCSINPPHATTRRCYVCRHRGVGLINHATGWTRLIRTRLNRIST